MSPPHVAQLEGWVRNFQENMRHVKDIEDEIHAWYENLLDCLYFDG